jgi:hypothetical protein
VPLAWAQAFFRAQIEASKIVQHELFDDWEASKRGPFPDAPDLASVTRPRIDRINADLMRALADNYAILTDPARREAVAQALRPVEAGPVSEKAVAQAIAPLVN